MYLCGFGHFDPWLSFCEWLHVRFPSVPKPVSHQTFLGTPVSLTQFLKENTAAVCVIHFHIISHCSAPILLYFIIEHFSFTYFASLLSCFCNFPIFPFLLLYTAFMFRTALSDLSLLSQFSPLCTCSTPALLDAPVTTLLHFFSLEIRYFMTYKVSGGSGQITETAEVPWGRAQGTLLMKMLWPTMPSFSHYTSQFSNSLLQFTLAGRCVQYEPRSVYFGDISPRVPATDHGWAWKEMGSRNRIIRTGYQINSRPNTESLKKKLVMAPCAAIRFQSHKNPFELLVFPWLMPSLFQRWLFRETGAILSNEALLLSSSCSYSLWIVTADKVLGCLATRSCC